MNHPDAVYGSLYLSPTGGSGSTVMINMSPLTRSGSEGNYVYSFDLTTPCDVKLRPTGGDWGDAQYTGTFGGAIDWVNANEPDNYAAFFGPQIGMSNTSGNNLHHLADCPCCQSARPDHHHHGGTDHHHCRDHYH